MNADEARKLSQINKENNFESESKKIIKKIVEAVKKGQSEIWVHGYIKEDVEEELTSIGYKIDKFFLDNKISW